MGGVVLAHLVEQVLQVERDRAVAPAVVGGGRAKDLVPEIRLQADRAGTGRHAEVGCERLGVRIEVEDRVERGSLGEELLHERRRPVPSRGSVPVESNEAPAPVITISCCGTYGQ